MCSWFFLLNNFNDRSRNGNVRNHSFRFLFCIAKILCRGFGTVFLNYISLYILLRVFATVNQFYGFFLNLVTVQPASDVPAPREQIFAEACLTRKSALRAHVKRERLNRYQIQFRSSSIRARALSVPTRCGCMPQGSPAYHPVFWLRTPLR